MFWLECFLRSCCSLVILQTFFPLCFLSLCQAYFISCDITMVEYRRRRRMHQPLYVSTSAPNWIVPYYLIACHACRHVIPFETCWSNCVLTCCHRSPVSLLPDMVDAGPAPIRVAPTLHDVRNTDVAEGAIPTLMSEAPPSARRAHVVRSRVGSSPRTPRNPFRAPLELPLSELKPASQYSPAFAVLADSHV